MKTNKLPIKVRAKSLVASIKKHQDAIERLGKRLRKVQDECKHPLGRTEGDERTNNLFFKCPDCLTDQWCDIGY